MKAVIIGLGWQGKRHYEALKELGVDLACVIDAKPDVVREKFLDIPPELISNSGKILEKYQPDVAIISTNASERLKIVQYCVEAGIKKIFCEKPMATNLNDAAEMIKITKSNGCMLAVNHLRRSNSNHLKMKKMLKEGVIGQIRHIYFQSGSAGLGNVGSHTIDNIRFYTDSEIHWVSGIIDRTGTPNVRGPQYNDPAGWGMIMMKDGTRVMIDTCEDTGVPLVLEIVGTYGRVVIEELNNNWQILAREKSDWKIPLTRYGTPLCELDFIKTIPWDVTLFTKNGLKDLIFNNKTNCDGYDGYKAIEGIIAMHISDKNDNSKVELPLIDENLNFDVPWA